MSGHIELSVRMFSSMNQPKEDPSLQPLPTLLLIFLPWKVSELLDLCYSDWISSTSIIDSTLFAALFLSS